MKATDHNPLAKLDVVLESTAEQVAAVLREAILDGRLAQGTYLREAPLAERFGISRNTVREATQILIGEGLVTREMHRGAFVSKLDADDIADLYRVRRIVELEAIAEAGPAEVPALRATIADMAAASAADDRAGIVDADLRFHRSLVEAMSSDRLGGLFASVQGELRLCLALLGGPFPNPANIEGEHQAILDALEASDNDRAGELLREHLDVAQRDLIRGLAELEAAPSPAPSDS